MSTIKQSELCFACEKFKGRHEHHVVPVTYDGPENGKKVLLCPTCHDLIHSEAEHYFTEGDFSSKLTKKQELLAKYIVEAKLRFMASGKDKADNARNMVSVKCSNEELLMFHMMKKKKGFKNLGRYIKHLVFEDYMKNR